MIKIDHDCILDDLEQRIINAFPFDLTIRCQEYDTHHKHGEIDFLWIHNNIAHSFEVKRTDNYKNRHKVIEQLEKDDEFICDQFLYVTKIHRFYVYSDKYMKRKYNVKEMKI